MATATRHVLQTSSTAIGRNYPGEMEAVETIYWINRGRPKAGRERVHKLLLLMQEFCSVSEPSERALSSDPNSPKKLRMGKMLLAKPGQLKRCLQLFQEIDARLSIYKVSPYFGLPTHLGWPVRWSPVVASGASSSKAISWGEVTCILAILELAKRGLSSHIRKCQQCFGWFYARFRHQRFCSSPCQQRNYWKSPDGKLRRRQYMRRYRKLTEAKRAK